MTVFPLWGGRRNPAAFFAFQGACRGDCRSGWVNGRFTAFPLLCLEMTAFHSKRKSEPFWRIFRSGILWWGGYIYFGRKVLYDLVYYQQVMTILENKKGKDFWSLK